MYFIPSIKETIATTKPTTTITKLVYPVHVRAAYLLQVNEYWLCLTCAKYRCNRQALRYFEFLIEAEKKTFIRNNIKGYVLYRCN